MKNVKIVFILFFMFILTLALACSPSEDEDGDETTTLTYVGSDACKTCHSTIYDNFIKTGHNYKLNKISNGQAPSYLFSTVNVLPFGYTWDDISYVIGGYAWKARYMDTSGYVLTGNAVQYNLATKEFVAYNADQTNKKYNCGPCHTTRYSEEGSQGNLPGIVGTWQEDGIQCEECHGAGSRHVDDPDDYKPTIDTSSELCGRCHTRNNDLPIEAKNGFIRHREQYEELEASPHKNLNCVSCHDPHISSVYASEDAIIKDCTTCHASTVINLKMENLDCVTCHMPFAVKSAVTYNDYMGDIRAHLFRINSDSTASMFYESAGSSYARGYLTLDFACLGNCHTDKTISWAADYAGQIH